MRKCIASDTSQYDLWGKLICSNFKISFITDDPMPLQVRLICMLFNCIKALYSYTLYLEKEMATHSNILAWKILWTEEPGKLQSMESQKVRHD